MQLRLRPRRALLSILNSGTKPQEWYQAFTVSCARVAALAQVAEEAQQARLLSERAAREARMEDAIVRARIRLEHEERLSWSRRLEQAALAVRTPRIP